MCAFCLGNRPQTEAVGSGARLWGLTSGSSLHLLSTGVTEHPAAGFVPQMCRSGVPFCVVLHGAGSFLPEQYRGPSSIAGLSSLHACRRCEKQTCLHLLPDVVLRRATGSVLVQASPCSWGAGSSLLYSPPTGNEVEAQRSQVTCLSSHSTCVAEPRLELTLLPIWGAPSECWPQCWAEPAA